MQNDYREYQFEVGEYLVHLFVSTASPELQRLDEARHKGTIELAGKYSTNRHPIHTPPGQIHLHLFAGQNQIAALNQDGSGHDGYSGKRLPNTVADAIRRKFPDFHVPKDNIIESVPRAVALSMKLDFLCS